jgi:Putative DNA-binding domain
MSIYTSPVSQITTNDLAQLLEQKAVENLRLEFKSKEPNNEETLKKLSSFANSYGGFLVVGVSADSGSGQIGGISGVDEIPGYKQKIVDWCFQGVTPPIQVDVSVPIPTPDSPSKYCYVIRVEESLEAPHFLHGRKGIWVRINEFSGKALTKPVTALAEAGELQQLFHRRSEIVTRREKLLTRARRRFELFLESLKQDLSRPAFELSVIPRFPSRPYIEESDLASMVTNNVIKQYRQIEFPNRSATKLSQHESILLCMPHPSVPSLLECNVWGMAHYGCVPMREFPGPRDNYTGTHIGEWAGLILVFLEHASKTLNSLGILGDVLVLTRVTPICISRLGLSPAIFMKCEGPGRSHLTCWTRNSNSRLRPLQKS